MRDYSKDFAEWRKWRDEKGLPPIYDNPADASAVAALRKALDEGTVKKDETVMLNITGAGMLNATSKGFELKKPDLILSTELSAEEVIASVDRLF